MSNTPNESPDPDDQEPEVQARFSAIPLSQLPESIRQAFSNSVEQDNVAQQVKRICDKKDGEIEAKLLPEFSLALQNDFRVTNEDALCAQSAAYRIIRKAREVSRRSSYWATAHLLRYVSAALALEAEMQLEIGLLQEDKFPGSTTKVENLSLPKSEGAP